MEVHHHPHVEHREKPWKEYLLEGLMIFLAVSLGFIAENIREHLTEANRKKELLEIVALDFGRDINQLNFHKDFAFTKIHQCDSLNQMFDASNKSINEAEYTNHLLLVQGWWLFNSNNKSRNEAEAKGYLSTIENSELANAILKFEFFSTDYSSAQQREFKFADEFIKLLPYIANHEMYDSTATNFQSALKVYRSKKMGIKNIDRETIERSKFILTSIKSLNYGYIQDIDSMKVYAKKSIELIHKQYHD